MLRSLCSGLLGLAAVAALAAIPLACQSGGVGDPCTPDDESSALFDGFDISETYIESRAFQCSTRICLVNHFQGRVSCPLGQAAAPLGPSGCQTEGGSVAENEGKACCVPGSDAPVGVPVCGQCDAASNRDAAQTVYCSCRCDVADGDPPEPDFEFCACPGGFTCSQIRSDLALGDPQLTGKYCVKDGTAFGATAPTCGASTGNHGAPCL
jgi:hypothetical protein